MNKNDILSVREQIQEDLICLLDSQTARRMTRELGGQLPVQALQTAACQIVVDNFNKLDLDSLDSND